MTDDLGYTISRKTFDQLLMHESFKVDRKELRVSTDYDIITDMINFRIEKFCVADKLAEERYTERFEFETPAGTWQMFKFLHQYSWWLGWFVRRYPVSVAVSKRKMAIEVKRYHLYPEVTPPSLGRPIIYEQVNRKYD